jgi:signal transduction histidine kinase
VSARFSRLWPDSLIGRTALVLILGVIASNVIGFAVLTGERMDVLTTARGRELAEQVATAVGSLEAAEPAARRQIVWSLHRPGLRLIWSQRPLVPADPVSGWRFRLMRRAFVSELGAERARGLRLAPLSGPPPAETVAEVEAGAGPPPPMMQPMMPPRPHGRFLERLGRGGEDVVIGAVPLNDGTWLNFAAPLAAFRPFWTSVFFPLVLISTAVTLGLSFWAVRRATRPLAMFALAADRLGLHMNAEPLAEDGPSEVRLAARAFNRMQARLETFVRDRTQMLAAISHDLRTPITRMRLRAEMMSEGDQQRRMLADLDEIQAMIEATLSFARDDAVAEPPKRFDLAALVQTVADEAEDGGGQVEVRSPPRAPFLGRPLALKRALANLIGNALRYGTQARVTLEEAADHWSIIVDDDGPGVPEAELERVFEPFYRLETSRSRDTGGVGLGLAVVRSIVTRHGGRVVLANRAGGGLRATVTLPKGTTPEPPPS